MLFKKLIDNRPQKTGVTLGQTVEFDIPRDYHLDSALLRISGTVGTAAATLNADGIAALAKNLRLTVNDGVRTRAPIDCSGIGLIEIARQYGIQTTEGRNFMNGSYTSTGAFVLEVPIFFVMPNVATPMSEVTLLPLPQYQVNPTLQVQVGSQADLDVHASPTFALTGSLTVDLVLTKRDVTIQSFKTLDTEIVEMVHEYPSTGNRQRVNLPVPGAYAGIHLMPYTSTSAKGDNSTAGGTTSLEFAQTTQIRCQLSDLAAINSQSLPDTVATRNGGYILDFLNDGPGRGDDDFGSVLDTTLANDQGADVYLLRDVTGGAGVKDRLVLHRILGPIADLQRGKK